VKWTSLYTIQVHSDGFQLRKGSSPWSPCRTTPVTPSEFMRAVLRRNHSIRGHMCYSCITVIFYSIYTVSQKNVPPLQLAIIFTYTVRLRQFWHKCCRESRQSKCTLFSHHTSASVLPGETGNPEIASFHLNAACFFTKKHETQLKYHWSELNYLSLSKWSTECTSQDLGREHSILLSVTHMFCVSQVCHSVSHC